MRRDFLPKLVQDMGRRIGDHGGARGFCRWKIITLNVLEGAFRDMR